MNEQLLIQKSTLVDIADAVRVKTGKTGEIAVVDLAAEIEENINVGVELPELTNPGKSTDLLSGQELIDNNGNIITGTMPNNNAVSKTLDTLITSYTIPEGYHNGSGKVSITTETKFITPTKSVQTISPTSGKVLSSVTVNAIPDTYQDVSEVTATASDVLSGKKIVNNSGSVVTGTIVTKTSNDLTTSGATVTVPGGYYASQATKSVATATRAETTITTTADDTNDKLTITASNNQTTGYVTGANKTASTTVSLTANGATVTASDGTKSISKSVASGSATTPATTITKAPAISVNSSGLITASVSETQNVTPTINAGYVSSGSAGTITVSGSATKQLTTQAAKTVTPTKSAQTVVSAGVYTTGEIKISAIPSEYITTTDATADANEIMDGKIAYVNGNKITGTMPNNGSISSTMDGINTKSISIPSGYTAGGSVSLDNTIDAEVDEQTDLITQIKNAVDNLPSIDSGDSGSYDEGYEAGKSAEWNAFWDAFQKNGTRTLYDYAFYRLQDTSKFYPKHNINATNIGKMFQYFGNPDDPLDISARFEECGIEFDTSAATGTTGVYYWTSGIKRIPETSTVSSTSLYTFCHNCGNLETIDKVILKDDGSQSLESAFTSCPKLKSIVFEGTIGYNGVNFSSSTLLTHNSLMSIINALKDYSEDTSGTTHTVKIGSTNKAKLTADELQIASDKGWTVN